MGMRMKTRSVLWRWREVSVEGTVASAMEKNGATRSAFWSYMKKRLRCCRRGEAVAMRKKWRCSAAGLPGLTSSTMTARGQAGHGVVQVADPDLGSKLTLTGDNILQGCIQAQCGVANISAGKVCLKMNFQISNAVKSLQAISRQ